jgi:hypothetical protein
LTSLALPNSIPTGHKNNILQRSYHVPEPKAGFAGSDEAGSEVSVIGMTREIPMAKKYNIVSRIIAAAALVFIYMVSIVGTSGLFLAASTSSAEAQWGRGRGRGYYRGRGRGYGRGYGYGGIIIAPPIVRGRGCYWSPRWGRTICPY